MTIAFYQQLAHFLAQQPVVVATVIQGKGSVPREVGAKMGILANGQTFSTIGGGAGEAKVICHALTVLETGEKQRVDIDLTGAPQRETQGICGGMMQVWLERWQGEHAIALTQKILSCLNSGQSATLVTPLVAEQFPALSDGTIHTNPSDAFVETLQPPPALLIVGAGHCGVQLAKVADLIGFQVMVQDDRPEWANPQHYPQAAMISTDPIATIADQLANHTQLYAALVTRGYTYDQEALTVLLQREVPCRYIGMIGSEKRVRQVMQAIAPFRLSPQVMATVHAPIGLDLGALTPAEIAVSISAELILVRRGGTGRPLSEKIRLASF